MKHRILSALIAMPVFILMMIYAPLWLFALTWLVLVALTANEMAVMLTFSYSHSRVIFVLSAVVLSAFVMILTSILTNVFSSRNLEIIRIFIYALVMLFNLVLWLLVVPVFLFLYKRKQHLPVSGFVLAGILLMMLTGFSTAVMTLRLICPVPLFIGLFFVIWASDAGAYFVGKYIGKTPFAPTISPNKTWEGFFGGLICAALFIIGLVITLGKPTFSMRWEILFFFIISMTAVVYASIGDLFESILKRQAGIKDSGNIMPGHGGVYDRIDSWLPSMVIWSVSINWLEFIKDFV